MIQLPKTAAAKAMHEGQRKGGATTRSVLKSGKDSVKWRHRKQMGNVG